MEVAKETGSWSQHSAPSSGLFRLQKHTGLIPFCKLKIQETLSAKSLVQSRSLDLFLEHAIIAETGYSLYKSRFRQYSCFNLNLQPAVQR
jgi:hypothetical protein